MNAGANKRSTWPGTRPGNDRDGPSKLNRGNSSGRPVKANRNRRDPGRARRVAKERHRPPTGGRQIVERPIVHEEVERALDAGDDAAVRLPSTKRIRIRPEVPARRRRPGLAEGDAREVDPGDLEPRLGQLHRDRARTTAEVDRTRGSGLRPSKRVRRAPPVLHERPQLGAIGTLPRCAEPVHEVVQRPADGDHQRASADAAGEVAAVAGSAEVDASWRTCQDSRAMIAPTARIRKPLTG